jgi:hypothetical protein
MPLPTAPEIDDASRTLQFKILSAQFQSMGGGGVFTGENFTGDAVAIQCVTDCTFTTFTENNDSGGVTGVVCPAGTILLNALGITAVVAGVGELFRAYLR